MTPKPPSRTPRLQWLWWLMVALLGAALVIDLIDGAVLKSATTACLLAAALLGALTRQPRPLAMHAAISMALLAAGTLMIYRLFGPGA